MFPKPSTGCSSDIQPRVPMTLVHPSCLYGCTCIAKKQKPLTTSARILFLISAVYAMTLPACLGQDASRTPQSDQQLLSEFYRKSAVEVWHAYFREPPYPLFAIRRIIELGDPVVIPELEHAFAREQHDTGRQFLAAALVSLGDSHPEHFEYLTERARIAVASNLPFPVRLGARRESNGSIETYSTAFLSWTRRHGNQLEAALWRATFEFPGALEALGEAADPRSRPILLRGLRSPNVLVVFEAALGLARLQDTAAVSSIVAAAKGMDTSERKLIAKALLYFDTATAQRSAELLINDALLFQRWRADVSQRGWKAAMRDNGH